MPILQDQPSTDLLVSRQPVFDRRLEPWATAVRFDTIAGQRSPFGDEATANLLLEAYMPQRGGTNPCTMVSFPAPAVLEGVPKILWPQGVIVEIDERAGLIRDIPGAAAELKRAGFAIAVGDFRNTPGCGGLCALADLLVIDADDLRDVNALVTMEGRIQAAHGLKAKALVRGLSSWSPMIHARTANADFFQGIFFHRMNIKPNSKSITASQLSRMRLLECLGQPDPDFQALARVVEADAALTYRLLLFLNSASFGFARKVTSIQQAIVLAGWQPLKKWLEVVLLTDLSPTSRHQELCYYAALRSVFMRRVAKAAGLERISPQLALLGLLSFIEPIMEMPPEQALEQVPLAEPIRDALCGRKSVLSPWLALARSMENAQWESAAKIGASASLTLSDLSRCFLESLSEADTMFRLLPPPGETR